MSISSRMRTARSLCMALVSLSLLSACSSTESNMAQWWYDQRWESSND